MKSQEDLLELFESKLQAPLLQLDKIRKKILWKYLICIILSLLAILIIFISLNYRILLIPNHISLIIGVLLIPFVVGFFFSGISAKRKYRLEFKYKVIKEIIRLYDPNWLYDPRNCISQRNYINSQLFTTKYDRYKGEDKIIGKIDQTDFEISELVTQYKKVRRDSKGRRKTSYHTIFSGVFAHADFHKNIKGETFVLPDVAERLFGKIGQKFQSFSNKGKLIKMENPDFEKLFVVYGSDQIESRYVLTPAMMEAMIKIRVKYGYEVSFSFRGSRVYMAMNTTDNLLEPKLFSVMNYSHIEKMAAQIEIIKVVIKEMNLNTRIWSK